MEYFCKLDFLMIYLEIHFLIDGVGEWWWAEGPAASVPPAPPPPAPPLAEHFCEFVGFDAQRLIQ